MPRVITGEVAFGVFHVRLGKFPEPVEKVLLAEECGNRHAVAHAFGADVVVADIHDVRHVIAFVKANAFVFAVAFEQLRESLVEFCLDFGGSLTNFFKNVSHGI